MGSQVHENLKDQSARDCLVAVTGPDQILSGVDMTLTRQFKAPLLLLYIALHTSCKHPFLRLLQVGELKHKEMFLNFVEISHVS